MAHSQAQPEGPLLFFRPTGLSLAYVAWLRSTHCVLLDKATAAQSQLLLAGSKC